MAKLDERRCGHLEPVEELTGAKPALGPAATTPASGSVFDHGMFSAAVNGRAMRWAFMPPDLNT